MKRILARHKWVPGATITESIDENESRHFTATIRGWRNWKICTQQAGEMNTDEIISRVKAIKARIDSGDESVFLTREGI